MKQMKIEINYDFVSESELSKEDLELVNRAKEATKNSYANYSHFNVGAALRLENGDIKKMQLSLQAYVLREQRSLLPRHSIQISQ